MEKYLCAFNTAETEVFLSFVLKPTFIWDIFAWKKRAKKVPNNSEITIKHEYWNILSWKTLGNCYHSASKFTASWFSSQLILHRSESSCQADHSRGVKCNIRRENADADSSVHQAKHAAVSRCRNIVTRPAIWVCSRSWSHLARRRKCFISSILS